MTATGCSVSEASYANVQLVDENGNPYGVPTVEGKPRVSDTPYLYDIAEKAVPGHKAWNKYGFNPNVGTAIETVWDFSTTYTFPVAAIQMEIVSDSANDTALGSGARTVTIDYLDGSLGEHSETLTMAGLVVVPTVATNIYRINSFRCVSAGSGGRPAGNIILRGIGAGTTYDYMAAGFNRARTLIYTVPANKILFITSVTYSVSEATKGVRIISSANYDDSTDTLLDNEFFLNFSEIFLFNQSFYRPLETPTRFTAGTNVKVGAVSTQAGAVAFVALRGWIEDR